MIAAVVGQLMDCLPHIRGPSQISVYRMVHLLYVPQTTVDILHHRCHGHRLPYMDDGVKSVISKVSPSQLLPRGGSEAVHLVQEPSEERHLQGKPHIDSTTMYVSADNDLANLPV